MKSYIPEYKTVSCECRTLFYGANTHEGFSFCSDPALDERGLTEKIIIKGGPGTGKSTLMRKWAEAARDAGSEVTFYLCSSDPSSVDAVLAVRGDERRVVCDGTAPHAAEAQYPGAVSHIFDVSAFWKCRVLSDAREEIISLADSKAECFSRAYGLLSAAHRLNDAAEGLIDRVMDDERLGIFAEKHASRAARGKGRRVFREAVTMKGAVMIDDHTADNARIYAITDHFGASFRVISRIVKELDARGAGYEASVCPYDTTRIDSVFIPSSGVVFTVIPTDRPHRNINIKRFMTDTADDCRQKLKFFAESSKRITNAALDSLAEASVYHYELERIYSSAMRFRALDKALGDKLISRM